MRTLLLTLVLLAFAAGFASAPPPKKSAAKVKKVSKAAHTSEEVQAHFAAVARRRQPPSRACESCTQERRTCKARGACRCRKCRAVTDRPVRHLGRLHRDTERQEGLLRTRQAVVVENQSAEPPARSILCIHLDAACGEGVERSVDHDRLCAEAGLRRLGGGRRLALCDVLAG